MQRSRYVQIDDGLQNDIGECDFDRKPLAEKSIREILGLQTKAEVDRIVSDTTNARLAEQLKLMEHERQMQEMIHIKYMLQREVVDRRHRLLGVKLGFQAKLATLRNKARQFMTCEKLFSWVD